MCHKAGQSAFLHAQLYLSLVKEKRGEVGPYTDACPAASEAEARGVSAH